MPRNDLADALTVVVELDFRSAELEVDVLEAVAADDAAGWSRVR